MTKRNILIISHDIDLAGVNYGIKQAFDRYSDRYAVRQVVGAESYIKYPYDLMWMGNNTEVNDLYAKADLVHMTEHPYSLTSFTPKIWETRPMPTVLHQHGTTFRVNPRHYLDYARDAGWTQIVSTIDLKVDDSLEWVPNPVDFARLSGMRRKKVQNSPNGKILVSHAPTNRAEKHTSVFLANMIRIAAENPDIAYDVIEGQSWEVTLGRKLHADLFYDQLTYGYGNNAIESMAMGIPTIGGFANPALLAQLPYPGFYQSSPGELGNDLRTFLDSLQMRKTWGELGQEYVQRVHDEPVVVKQLESIYDRTIERFHK